MPLVPLEEVPVASEAAVRYSGQVASWLPFLWSRVLFPGITPVRQPARFSAWALLIIIPSILLYPRMSFQLFEPDEGRYAEIPREMMVRGEWTVPYLQGEPYLDKPPLLYWLVGISYRLFGPNNWSARLIPALAIHGCILITYLVGRRLLGERPAFWGALLLALAPGFVTIGRLLVLDGLLALWVTLSLLAAFEAIRDERLRMGWWLLSAAALGFSPAVWKDLHNCLATLLPLCQRDVGRCVTLVYCHLRSATAVCLPFSLGTQHRALSGAVRPSAAHLVLCTGPFVWPLSCAAVHRSIHQVSILRRT